MNGGVEPKHCTPIGFCHVIFAAPIEANGRIDTNTADGLAVVAFISGAS